VNNVENEGFRPLTPSRFGTRRCPGIAIFGAATLNCGKGERRKERGERRDERGDRREKREKRKEEEKGGPYLRSLNLI
jgi:hypothetical protein